jgi:hypothetical protein
MNRRSLAAAAFSIAAIAVGTSVPVAVGSSAAQLTASARSATAPVTVQFPTFASSATTATLSFHPDRLQVAGVSASAVTRLFNLESAGRVTPAVVVKLGSTSTFTLVDVIVTSIQSSALGGAPSFQAVLAYGSIQST